MKQNKYDDHSFFDKYSQMSRSTLGLSGAGEWHALQPLLPDFRGRRVLDLGCGFGWHCRYAAEQGAARVLGIDLSERMLDRARAETDSPVVEYRQCAIEDARFEPGSFDAVISSLAFHYLADFDAVCGRAQEWLAPGGAFVFSVEHPVFTAQGPQDWVYGDGGEILHWPVDRYFFEGPRDAVFLGEPVVKHHRTLTGYVQALLKAGYAIENLVEPQPHPDVAQTMPDELRRPMMLIIAARKR